MSIEITEKYVILKRFLSVAYGLSESEIDTFLRILESKEGKDIDAISAELKISKSRTSIILKKLAFGKDKVCSINNTGRTISQILEKIIKNECEQIDWLDDEKIQNFLLSLDKVISKYEDEKS